MSNTTLKVVASVFGRFTHGKKKGQVNPKSAVTMTLYGNTVKDAFGKLFKDFDDRPTYKIQSVTEVS